MADIQDQAVRDKLAAKYPARGRDLPDTVLKGCPVSNMKGLRDSLLKLEKGVSPGTGGLRPEYLITLAEVMDGEKMGMLEDFCMQYLQGDLAHWFYAVFPTSQTVPLFKNTDKEIRPIGIKNPLLRTAHREVITTNKQELVRYLEPQQLVLSKAGAAKLVNSVRMMLEANPGFIAVKIDMKNAFNSCHRAALLKELEKEPTLQHLAWHAATSLAPHSGLEGGGRKWGESGEGFTQGDPESAVWFCIPMQPYVKKMDAVLATGGGIARFGMDDGYGVGPPELVFRALEEFERDVQENCGLELQRTKCEVFNWQGVLPDGTLPGLTLAGAEVAGRFEPGMVVYGVPVGTNSYVQSMMDIKVEEVARKAAKACEVLAEERQALWTTLRLSIQQQLDYWLMLVHPSQMERAAVRMDEIIWDVLEKVIGAHIPRGEEGLGYESSLNIPCENLRGHSFQSWVAFMPIRLGGLGLRSQVDLAPIAYIGAIEQTVPYYGGEKGVCQPLAHMMGEDLQTRWQPLLQSGLPTGREVAKAWNKLQQENSDCSQYLREEASGQLTFPVEGMGDGSVDGSTRAKVVEEREELRAKVLKQALADYPDSTARPVWSWKQRDKLSTAFLLNIPGAHTSLSSPIFSEAMAALLCIPSLVCRDRVGEVIGDSRVDLYGDRVVGQNLPGGGWTRRHDTVKLELNSCCVYAGLQAVCEPFGLFSQFLPQQPLHRLQYRQTRQCLRPDFLLHLPLPTGQVDRKIADVKTVSLGVKTYYKPGAGGRRAVDIRDAEISGEYRRTAAKMDVALGHVVGEGPAQRRLAEYGQVMGLCFGGLGEASKEVHSLIEAMASTRLKIQGMAMGRPGSEQELAIITGYLRRRISAATVRANFTCLLERMGQVGEGAVRAGRRRDWVRAEEEKMRWDRQAQWLSRVRGVGLVQKGRFFA